MSDFVTKKVYLWEILLHFVTIDLVGTMFANGLRDQGSISGCHTKDSKNGTWCHLA